MDVSAEIKQSLVEGYKTPPRSSLPSDRTYSQAKLLTSAELKQRFTSRKKRRHNNNFLRKIDNIVPLEHHHFNMPVIFKNLFNNETELLDKSFEEDKDRDDDGIVPFSFQNSTNRSFKKSCTQPILNYFIKNSLKIDQENTFTISETILKEKFKFLLQNK